MPFNIIIIVVVVSLFQNYSVYATEFKRTPSSELIWCPHPLNNARTSLKIKYYLIHCNEQSKQHPQSSWTSNTIIIITTKWNKERKKGSEKQKTKNEEKSAIKGD